MYSSPEQFHAVLVILLVKNDNELYYMVEQFSSDATFKQTILGVS